MPDSIQVNDLAQKRFNALAGRSRSPAAAYIFGELAWFANAEGTVIGVVLRDTVDNDFAAVVLGRDEVDAFGLPCPAEGDFSRRYRPMCAQSLVRYDPKKAKISDAFWWVKLEPFLEP
jgi:hypothetical protein